MKYVRKLYIFGGWKLKNEFRHELIVLTKKENKTHDLEVSEAEISKNKHIQMPIELILKNLSLKEWPLKEHDPNEVAWKIYHTPKFIEPLEPPIIPLWWKKISLWASHHLKKWYW